MEPKCLLTESPFLVFKSLKSFDFRELFRFPTTKSAIAPTRMISIVIPAHNEQNYLRETLDALQQQTYGWLEVIVVANGCSDRTAEIARGRCHRLIVLSKKNLGLARNLGARMARGEVLLFLDADTVLDSTALHHIARAFTPDCAGGTVKGKPSKADPRYRFLYFLKNLLHRSGLHPGSSGVILCWKEHFVRVGGFDEGLEVRENSHLIRRLLRYGRYKYVGAVTASTSMRRFESEGFARVAWLWARVWLQSLFGDLHRRQYAPVR
jgi:glycosyltransferase involved in cell wall biosynthesis